MSEKYKVEQQTGAELFLESGQIYDKIQELARQLSADYADACPVFIGVLNGSFIFLADLVRALSIDCEIDFVKISSYGNSATTSGEVKIIKDTSAQIKGRDVIVVEDIVDSGYSLQFLKRHFAGKKPKSLKYMSLLVKKGAARVDYTLDYEGFEVPNKFVVGYGLDKAQLLRNLPAIYLLDQRTISDR